MFVVFPALAKRLSLALGVFVLAALSGPAASLGQAPTQDSAVGSGSAHARTCRPEGSTTLKTTRQVRIYKVDTLFYACLYSRGKGYVIGEQDCQGGPGEPRAIFRFAGRYLAYAVAQCNIDQAKDAIRVLDLTTGKNLVATSASRTLNLIVGNGSVYVTDMELKFDGSVAWIVKVKGGTPTREEVRKSDRTLGTGKRKDSKLLDSGNHIASRSLTREGSTISWMNAGIEKTASLK
jgi:hypothetical protein